MNRSQTFSKKHPFQGLLNAAGAPETLAVLVVTGVSGLAAYATFANGGYFLGALTLCVTGSWILLIAYILAGGRESLFVLTAPRLVPAGILAALWIWAGLSMIWSITAELSWVEFNRTGGYLALFMIGILAGRRSPSHVLAAVLFLALASAAAAYGLGAKALPSVVENLDNVGRLAIPLGYTNAFGLLMAMAYPITLFMASAAKLPWWLRISSVAVAPILLAGFFFTMSRGAIFALTIGLIFYFSLTPLRLRSLGALMLTMSPSLLIFKWSIGQDVLIKDKIETGLKMEAAASLQKYLLAAVVTEVVVFSLTLLIGKNVSFSRRWTRTFGALALSVIVIIAVLGGAIFVKSKPSFREWTEQTYHDFRYGAPTQAGAARLFVVGSSGRWRLWEEATTNWEENPVVGTGGQSFPIVHLMKRESGRVFVKQPHGLPFRLLTELGIIGFVLGMSFIAFVQMAAARLICRLKNRWEKALATTFATVLVVYLVHTSYDWDWNMFALTMVFFFFAGILIGWQPGKRRRTSMRRGLATTPD